MSFQQLSEAQVQSSISKYITSPTKLIDDKKKYTLKKILTHICVGSSFFRIIKEQLSKQKDGAFEF